MVTPVRRNPRPPAGFEVRYRPAGGRWRVLATAPTREAAVARMFALMDAHRGGGWHVRPTGDAAPEPHPGP